MRAALALVIVLAADPALAQEPRDLRAGRGDASGQCAAPAGSAFRTATAKYRSPGKGRYIEIEGTRVEFEADERGCAILTFSAEVEFSFELLLTAIVDGKVALPGPVWFGDGRGSELDVRSFTFVVPNLAPGKHTAWIEAKTFDCCLTVGYRTLVVQHP